MASVRFKVKIGNGMPDDVRSWAVPGTTRFLEILDDKLRIADKTEIGVGSSGTIRWSETSSFSDYDLEGLRFVAYEGIGTKSNIGALAVFGTLGLGARRHWTLITVGFFDRDGQFLTRASAHEVRGSFQTAIESSPNLKSLLVEGTPPSVPTRTVDTEDTVVSSPLDELERLATLYKSGLLTDDEYAAMKAKLIADS